MSSEEEEFDKKYVFDDRNSERNPTVLTKEEKKLKKQKRKKQRQAELLPETSDSMAEDDNGELDNDDVILKVFSTISKIRNKNPEIYQKDVRFFDEQDYRENAKKLEKGDLGKRDSPYTYKKMIGEDVAEHGVFEDEFGPGKEMVIEETPFEVEQRIKTEFKSAAKFNEGEDEEEDLFKIKKKTKDEILDEEEQMEKFIKRQKKQDKQAAKEIETVWKDKEKLDEGDLFLRNFILTKGWIDKEDDAETKRWKMQQKRKLGLRQWRTWRTNGDQKRWTSSRKS
jgi:protein KRI1